jgi:hypothetical protein
MVLDVAGDGEVIAEYAAPQTHVDVLGGMGYRL